MTGLFPDERRVRGALVAVAPRPGRPRRRRGGAARGGGRDGAAADPAAALTLVHFLHEVRGPDAARAELDRLAAAAADPAPYRRARAALDFAAGDAAEAIAAMRGLLEGAAPSDDTRDLQTGLAGMLAETGDAEAAAALLETVLAGDRDHVGALKLRAKLALDADRPEAAVQDMRTGAGPGAARRRGADDHGARLRARRARASSPASSSPAPSRPPTGRRRNRCATPAS